VSEPKANGGLPLKSIGTIAIGLLAATSLAYGAETEGPASGAAEDDPVPVPKGWHGRVQLRRENVDRGTSEETTRTYLRSDNFVWGGMLSFQVAFPDEGSGFNPRLGDSKTRYRFAAIPYGRYELSYFLEATFPTADPAELGTGKYQLSAGMTALTQGRFRYTAQLQQINSVAGDDQRPNINWTKLDLSLRDIHEGYWLKFAVNTRADWEQGGKTGAVGELEYGHRFSEAWSVWLLGGTLLWGEGVKGTYGTKLMLGLDRWF